MPDGIARIETRRMTAGGAGLAGTVRPTSAGTPAVSCEVLRHRVTDS